MKILLSGGSGYIGRNLVQKFSNKYDVTVLNRKEVDGAAFIPGDIRDAHLDLSSFDVVFHLAAVSHPSLAEKDEAAAWDVNVNGTKNIAQNLIKGQKIIFMSSAHVYDKNSDKKHKEDEIPFPSNFYGLTKLVGENTIKFYAKKNGFKYVILRLFNVYSKNQGPGLLVGDVIEKYRKKDKIEINNPDSVLDLVHMDDLVEVLEGAIHFEDGIYNVCSSHPISVKQVYEKIKRYVGAADKPHYVVSNKKTYLLGDNTKINSLGYKFREFSLG